MRPPRREGVYPQDMGAATSFQQTEFGRAHAAYGSNDPSKLFGASPSAPVPWPNGGKTKRGLPYDPERVNSVLRQPPNLVDVDPRHLHATQSSIVREHTNFYMGDEYERTGNTSADRANVGNRFPVVYRHEDGRNLLLSGHHRASAALLKGQPLRAREVWFAD